MSVTNLDRRGLASALDVLSSSRDPTLISGSSSPISTNSPCRIFATSLAGTDDRPSPMNTPDGGLGVSADFDPVRVSADLSALVSGSDMSAASVAEREPDLWKGPASPSLWGFGVAESPVGILSRVVLGGILTISTTDAKTTSPYCEYLVHMPMSTDIMRERTTWPYLTSSALMEYAFFPNMHS